MHPVWALLGAKRRLFAATLLDRRTPYLIRTLAMTIGVLGLAYGAYWFFHDIIFSYVAVVEDIGPLLMDRLIAVGFLIFFFLLVVSSLVHAVGTLYRSRETEYLFSTPLGVSALFTGKYLDILVFSSWSILVMAIPILAAYADVRDFALRDYVLGAVVVLVPFVIIAVSVGTLLAILLGAIRRYVGLPVLAVSGVVIVGAIIYLLAVFSQPTDMQIRFTEDYRALNLFINNFQMNTNPFLPNYWFIQSLRALILHAYREFALYAGMLISSAMMFLSLLYVIVEYTYASSWIRTEALSQTSSTRALTTDGVFVLHAPHSPTHALTQKDMLLFIRTPGQWSQFMIIAVLVILYFFNMTFIPKNIELEHWRTILFVMNLTVCGLILATLAMRFVYPAISLEGETFWVLSASPVSAVLLFRQKLFLAFTLFFLVAEPIGITAGMMLDLELLYRFLTVGGIFLMSIGLACLAVGLGAAFPVFSDPNPGKIVSSPGGVVAMVTSLIYVTITIILLTLPAAQYTRHLALGESFSSALLAASVSALTLLNLVIIILPLVLGARSFARREF